MGRLRNSDEILVDYYLQSSDQAPELLHGRFEEQIGHEVRGSDEVKEVVCLLCRILEKAADLSIHEDLRDILGDFEVIVIFVQHFEG